MKLTKLSMGLMALLLSAPAPACGPIHLSESTVRFLCGGLNSDLRYEDFDGVIAVAEVSEAEKASLLHNAIAHECSLDFIKQLHAYFTFDLNARLDGWAPVHYAAYYDSPEVIVWLAEQRADLNAKLPDDVSSVWWKRCFEWFLERSVGYRGGTALHIAVIRCNSASELALYRSGADITIKNAEGWRVKTVLSLENDKKED